MEKQSLTILIPTYKRPELLTQALNSAINQTVSHEAYNILVVDNDPAPDTETERLVAAAKADNIRYVKNEKNLGGYGNWNRGFSLSETEWVCLLHDDDLLLPTYVERALYMLKRFETPKLGAIIAWQCNMYDDPDDEKQELAEKNKNWKSRLDNRLFSKTAGRMWKIGLFDNYIICSAYPALSGGNLIRRSAVIETGGFFDKWPCEDIFFMNRMAQKYDCFLLGEQWGWYRYGMNNMWARPNDLLKWDMAKKLFREGAAKHSMVCRAYHRLFGDAMCVFDREESIKFAARRGTVVEKSWYTWLDGDRISKVKVRICRFNRNVWHIWMSLRAMIFGKRV